MNEKNKILAIDDENSNLAVFDEILSEQYDLKLASSGDEGMEILEDFYPDIILLDIMMPKINGYEICQRIKADGRFSSSKIVFVSAKAMMNERLKGYGFGADDYITKPFNEDELLAKVNALSKLDYKIEIEKIKRRILMLFSHEMNTPLNAILGYVQVLELAAPLDSKQKECIRKIYQAAKYLEKLSKKALLLCDVKSKTKISSKPFCIHTLIEEVLTELEFFSTQQVVSFDMDLVPDIQMTGDPGLMKQAFLFIIENAIKYSPKKGTIKISSKLFDDTYIMRIEDQGGGIDDDKYEAIFDEFSITDMEHHQRGQGLSLSIARNIVRLHKGEIFAVKHHEGGAVFMFWLPYDKSTN